MHMIQIRIYASSNFIKKEVYLLNLGEIRPENRHELKCSLFVKRR